MLEGVFRLCQARTIYLSSEGAAQEKSSLLVPKYLPVNQSCDEMSL